MTADRDSIERLLASISDGAPADWPAAEAAADASGRAGLETLRDLERIADFHRELQRTPEAPPAPERWGDLLILARLGAGARAHVYRAWDAKLQREVALKLMPGGADEALLEEGRALARVRHPNVVAVHGADRHDGRVGLWMELVRGASVEQQVRASRALAPAEARRLGIEIGSALGAVHAAGLLHRDVKPANVVRGDDGGFVLADFGLGGAGGDAGRVASGTPMYMAPERLAGGVASERSDLYGLGLLLWFALTGRHPFDTDRFETLVELARIGPRPTLRERAPGTPAPLARIVEQAIAPDPERRFASAPALVAALEAWTPARAAAGRTAALAIAAVATLVAIGWAALGVWRGKPAPHPTPEVAGPPAVADYTVEANLLRREVSGTTALATGDRVRPGDRLMLEFHSSRAAWVYVLNEDERGERYLLFPQPRFDAKNPVAAESTWMLPGTIGGKESAWRVTSAGGREHFLVVASPEPVAEIEAELGRLPAPDPARPIDYARVGDAAVERLRGVGGIDASPPPDPNPPARASAFDRFRALAGRESGVRGVWVRQVVLVNPGR